MINTRRKLTSSPIRRALWRHLLGLGLLVAALPADRAGATTADDLCAADANPCVVTDQVAVTDGSVLAFGEREVVVATGGALNADSGMMTITAGSLRVEAAAEVRAIGRGEPGGRISASAGTIIVAGTIAADGSDGGVITLVATEALLNGGTISANGTSGVGGSVELTGSAVSIAGDVSARGAGDNLGGCVTASADEDVDLVGDIDVTGGDGGEIVVIAGLVGGDLRIDSTAELSANGTGSSGGSGGGIELSARGDGIDTGHVHLDGTLQARAGTLEGGDGGCITVSAAGDVAGAGSGAELNVNSGSPDGFAGDISVVAAGNIALKTELSAQGSGSEGVGGDIEVRAGGNLLLDDNARISVAGPGDAGSIDLGANQGEVTIKSSSIDASGRLGGDGGDVRIRASGTEGRIVVGGAILANGAARGGAIEVSAGSTLAVLGPAALAGPRLQAQGGNGGAVMLRTLRGALRMNGRVAAPGLVSAGGTITAVSGGDLAIGGEIDADGNSRGGNVGLEASGPIMVDGAVMASAAGDGSGGRVDMVGAGPISITGDINANGSASAGTGGGNIALRGCDVDLAEGSLVSAGGNGGLNRVTGRGLITIGGMLMADPASGRNELVYRDAAKQPVVFGSASVIPEAMRIVDATLPRCAVCGDTDIEPPETCDDGNQSDGDGCSSTCQVEAGQCDVDGDGDVDAADITWLEGELFDGDGDRTPEVGGGDIPGTVGADANEDGRISSADLARCIEVFVNG